MVKGVEINNTAKALFELAQGSNDLTGWLSGLRRVSDLVNDSALNAALLDSKTSQKEKAKLLNDRAGGLRDEILKLVFLLIEKGRLADLDKISIEYQRLLDAYHGVEGAELAEVTTAIPMDEAARMELGKRLTEILGKPVIVRATVDASLIGGIIIRVGDKLIDGSIRHKLAALSKELV